MNIIPRLIRSFERDIRKFLPPGANTPQYKEGFILLKDLLLSAVNFSVELPCLDNIKMPEIELRLPFKNCVFQFTNVDGPDSMLVCHFEEREPRNSPTGKECVVGSMFVANLKTDVFLQVPLRVETEGIFLGGIRTIKTLTDEETKEMVNKAFDPKNSDLLMQVTMAVERAVYLMSCNNVIIETIPGSPPKTNAKRIKKGKLPIYETKVLVVGGQRLYRPKPQGGTHASPRIHLRRGHIRRLQSGETTWVTGCVVGRKHGVIHKDYKIQGETDNMMGDVD